MNCRHCKKKLEHIFIDLGFAPPSNAYLSKKNLKQPEITYPLRVFICNKCWLVQTEDYAQADEFFNSDYAYFSSTSISWLEHAKNYSQMITERLSLNTNSLVIEIAANDGYLLKNFINSSIPCIGIEPTLSTAESAKKLGINVINNFFDENLADELIEIDKKADLIIGNNVYAHVPDINDFTRGLKKLLKDNGTITLEFAYLLKLIQKNEFDTIYHEHFSYLSLHVVKSIFEKVGLQIYDVEELTTHGGSLRIFGCHEKADFSINESVGKQLQKEIDNGLLDMKTYMTFQKKAEKVKNELLTFLIEHKKQGKSVVGYGAAAKGNTLLNYAGIKNDLLPFICDASPSKQGKYLPGSHIPIFHPDRLIKEKPDFILILPWNIADEIKKQFDGISGWRKSFVVAIPDLSVS